jgi:hypothetical protein
MTSQNQGQDITKTRGQSGVSSSLTAPMPIPALQSPFPVTGDATIDAQIKVLVKERDDKMKAIGEEYKVKIQALVGNRPLLRPQMASGTMMRLGGGVQGIGATGSGTERGAVRGVMMRTNQGNGNNADAEQPSSRPVMGAQGGASQTIGQGIGAQFNSLFRGMFGGN